MIKNILGILSTKACWLHISLSLLPLLLFLELLFTSTIHKSRIKSIFSFFLTIPSQVIPLPIKTIIPHILSLSNSHLRKKQKTTNLANFEP